MKIPVLFSIVKVELKNCLYYRVDAFMSTISSLLYLFVNITIWKTIYHDDIKMQKSMITYFILTSIATVFVNDNLQSVFSHKIYSGSISSDFLLPISFKRNMLSVSIGKGLATFSLSTVPVICVAIIFWNILPPIDIFHFFIYILAQCGGFFLALEINFLLAQILLLTKKHNTTIFAFWALMGIFGGRYMPYWLYPKILLSLTELLPFHLLYSVPIAIYSGKLMITKSMIFLFYQFFWGCLLVFFNRIVYIKTLNLITIQGG